MKIKVVCLNNVIDIYIYNKKGLVNYERFCVVYNDEVGKCIL